MAKPEQHLQKQLCAWMKIQHPTVYFFSDPSGLRVPAGLRNYLKATRSHHAALDVSILESRMSWSGLILELKAKSPFKKDGKTLLSDPHLEDQHKTMVHLRNRGFMCELVWGFEQGKKIINDYLIVR